LAEDKGQYLPDGIMPSSGPATVAETEKVIGTDVSGVDPSKTYTNEFAQVDESGPQVTATRSDSMAWRCHAACAALGR
jgi:hypothetical protein